MAEQEKTAAQTKAEEVCELLRARLVAAQNLLRSLRQDYAEQCKLIQRGMDGDLDGLVKRMRELEKKILAMQRLVAYAEARAAETQPTRVDLEEQFA